jgi:S-adenosyl methyltransferase
MSTDISAGLTSWLAPPRMTTPRPDLARPNIARVYDYLLGGSTHWAVDRSFGRRINDAVPQFQHIVFAHRQFVGRVVHHLAKLGVRQFIDIGSGLLSWDNTHQLADEVAPDSRVVYVDNEPVVVAHTEVLLDEAGDPDRHAVTNVDLRYPGQVWEAIQATGLINRHEPVAVFIFSVLHHFKPDPHGNDLGAQIVAEYRTLLPAGSYLGISHLTADGVPAALVPKLRDLKHLCDTWCGGKVYSRSRAEISTLLGDFELVEPGLVWTPQWQPQEGECSVYADVPSAAATLVGVGRKPARSRP